MNAPRSIDEYLKQLRQALAGQDPALIQDALYDAEEYLRAEVAAHPDKSESDVLELIASTYGAPDEVAAAYRDTEAKVKAALKTPAPRAAANASGLARFFGVYQDPRAYTSLFYMLLTLATGIGYFTFVVTGLSLSAGFAVLIIGVPFFLAFIGIARVIALGEGRLLEAMTGERMPRRPLHPGAPASWWTRIGEMLADVRTWTTLLYLLIMPRRCWSNRAREGARAARYTNRACEASFCCSAPAAWPPRCPVPPRSPPPGPRRPCPLLRAAPRGACRAATLICAPASAAR
ncbi:MAG: hypothetical protein E6K44_12060 [Gammaproteobacteria bacterium]|nr:MAG: hypothetical protein E6K44_12060 [Gammaproteobacteria bacterium]